MSKYGFVYFCPDLRLYRYVVNDDSTSSIDYKFDEDELENTIASYLASEEKLKADVMASVTGLARLHPHKIVKFDEQSEKFEIVEAKDFWKEHDQKRESEIAEYEKSV